MIPEAATKLPRSFLVGYFVPSAIFLGAVLSIYYFEYSLTLPSAGTAPLDLAVPLVVVFLATAGIAVILQVFNIFIIKIFEGLLPDFGPLWAPLRRFHIWRLRRLINQIQTLKDKGRVDDGFALELKRFLTYPGREQDILPTRLGNTLAAWEHYPYRRYGIDAITMWPRLSPLLPKEMLSAIEAAKERFDMTLNFGLLSFVFGISWPLIQGVPFFSRETGSAAMGGLVGCVVFLRLSITAAGWWGEAVKSAFDLYRLEVLKRIGVVLPKEWSPQEERRIWQELQWSIKFSHTPSLSFKIHNNPEQQAGSGGRETQGGDGK